MNQHISISPKATQGADERAPWVRPELQRLDVTAAENGAQVGFDGLAGAS